MFNPIVVFKLVIKKILVILEIVCVVVLTVSAEKIRTSLGDALQTDGVQPVQTQLCGDEI